MRTKKFIRLFLNGLLVGIGLLNLPCRLLAQTDSSDTAEPGKSETSMELLYKEVNNRSKILSAAVKTKIEDTYRGLKGVTVNFYQKEAVPEQLLGTSLTDEKGVAVLAVPIEKLDKTQMEYLFVAAIEDDPKLEDNQEEITVAESDFIMKLAEEDSVRQVMISLQAPDAAGNSVAVAEAEVQLYVQRLFGLLPISDSPETTDENGEIAVEFPTGIPGDTAGNLIIVAKVEDHERFGNLEFRRSVGWGVPVVIDTGRHARELWSSRANAPLYLIILVNAVLISIWAYIVYIIYEVFQIKKIGRQTMP